MELLIIEHRLRTATLILILMLLLLVYLNLCPSLKDEKLKYSYRVRWLREKASTKMWQVTSQRAHVAGAASRLTSWLYVGGFEQAHPELCPAHGTNILVIVFVMSAPGNRVARQAVRLTWLSMTRDKPIQVLFLLGQPPDEMRKDLAVEDRLYQDLVIANFVDSYDNLTLKSISMLEWTDAYCPRAAFLLKTDDDVFINVPRLHAFVKSQGNTSRSLWGRLCERARVYRDDSSKYYVPLQEYSKEMYPRYLRGPAYLMTRDCVAPLQKEAARTKYLRMEDTFMTGVLAELLMLRRRHYEEFLYTQYRFQRTPHPCIVQRFVAIHSLYPRDQYELLWRLNQSPCSRWPRR